MKTSTWCLIGMTGLATCQFPRAARAVPDTVYLNMVRDYADVMLTVGRKRWGNPESPMFASMLDRTTHDLAGFAYELRLERKTSWGKLPAMAVITDREWTWPLDAGERMYDASNPWHDKNLFSLLYLLTEEAGDPRYAQAADDALAYFLLHCQDERTGLLAWGEHLGWHLPTDTWLAIIREGRLHEHKDWPQPLYDRAYALGEETGAAMQRYARGLARYQVHDLEAGLWSRHAHIDGENVSRSGYEFTRMIGELANIWSQAYAHSQDEEFRAEMLHAIDSIVAASAAKATIPGAVPWATQKRDRNRLSVQQNLIMAIGLERAAARLPEEQATRALALAHAADEVILRLPHEVEPAGRGLCFMVHVHTLEPGDPHRPEAGEDAAYSHPWANNVLALLMLRRYGQTGQTAYRDLALQTAARHLDLRPGTGLRRPMVPGGFLHGGQSPGLTEAIQLMLAAYEFTDQPEFLEQARALADAARELFFDGGSPLPMAWAGNERRYESGTGGPNLMYALLRLHRALDKAGHPVPLGVPAGHQGRSDFMTP